MTTSTLCWEMNFFRCRLFLSICSAVSLRSVSQLAVYRVWYPGHWTLRVLEKSGSFTSCMVRELRFVDLLLCYCCSFEIDFWAELYKVCLAWALSSPPLMLELSASCTICSHHPLICDHHRLITLNLLRLLRLLPLHHLVIYITMPHSLLDQHLLRMWQWRPLSLPLRWGSIGRTALWWWEI